MKNREPLIQIFCKAPVLGKVKTRLIQKLGARGALDLYQQMFERLMAELSASRFKTELWISQQKSTLANRPSPGQPITTNNNKLGSV